MNRERALQVVLTLVGLIFLVGVYPLMMFLWPSGWRWQPHQPEYEQMILGVYAPLGVAVEVEVRGNGFHDLSLSEVVGNDLTARSGNSSCKRRSRSQRPPQRRAPRNTGNTMLNKPATTRTCVATAPPK